MGDEQDRRTKWFEEPVHVAQALEALLDVMDARCSSGRGSTSSESLPERILPFSTGRVYLDRVLGGGVAPGTVTLFEADTASAALPLLIDIARHTDHPTLLSCRRVLWEAAVLWSAAARVPQMRMAEYALDDSDWVELNAVMGELARRDLWFTETISLDALRRGVSQHGAEVLAVDDIDRLSHPRRALGGLFEIAVEFGVAVVATASYLALEDLRGGDRLVRVLVHSDGGRSTLVRPDAIELLRVEDVLMDNSTGLVN